MEKTYIREMNIDDYAQVIAFWRNTPGIGLSESDSKINLNQFLERNPGLSFVFEVNKRIIGTILCGHDGRRGYIYHVAIDQESRRQGIGRKLMAHSLKELHRRHISKCHLFLYGDNEGARQFYERIGWKKRSELLIYSKNLSM